MCNDVHVIVDNARYKTVLSVMWQSHVCFTHKTRNGILYNKSFLELLHSIEIFLNLMGVDVKQQNRCFEPNEASLKDSFLTLPSNT